MSHPFQYQNLGTFRLALALLVVVSHTHALFGPPWTEHVLGPLQLGNIGVMAFFVASGYIIASACDQLYTNRIGAFLINRFMRIYPPFLIAFLVSYAVHAGANLLGLVSFDDTALGLKTVLRNLLSVFDPAVSAARNNYYLFVRYVWAIVIELQFYIVAAIVFWTSWRAGKYGARALRASYVLTVSACILSLFVWRWPPQLLGYGPFFLFGCVWYYFASSRNAPGGEQHWMYAGVAISLAMIMTSYWLYASRGSGPGAVESTLGFAASIALFCWLTTTKPLTLKPRLIDAFLGDLSYPVYLNHYLIEISFRQIRSDRGWLSLLGAIALTLLLSAVAALAVETVTRRTRDRFRGQPLVR